jgi:endonuclease/exonuclease/phosphatase family metal-dependent hydrolase
MSGSCQDGLPLRVATFNTRLLPHLISSRSRARSIAARIAQEGYDLIGLSEVLSRRGKRRLIECLSLHYPHGAWSLGSSHRFRLDSGLVLFSKMPLEDLGDSRCVGLPENGSEVGCDRSGSNAWFHEYTDRRGSDALATKGCAYVRISIRGHPLHVFLTHVQASYLNHSVGKYLRTVAVRASQIQQMAEFIEGVLGDGLLRGENVLIMGDFNVHWSEGGARYQHRGARLHEDEGQMMFRALGSIFPGGLVDVWQRYGPPGDPGLTYPAADPATRPDYILLSAADPDLPLCAQQVAVARSLAWDGKHGLCEPSLLSDHLGVEAELNLSAPECSIRDARALAVDGNGIRLQGVIEHPGGLQWYRLTAPGSYEVRVTGTKGQRAMRVEVYADDLSRPLVPQRSNVANSLTVREYTVADRSYLRMGDPGASAAGVYTLQVRKLEINPLTTNQSGNEDGGGSATSGTRDVAPPVSER